VHQGSSQGLNGSLVSLLAPCVHRFLRNTERTPYDTFGLTASVRLAPLGPGVLRKLFSSLARRRDELSTRAGDKVIEQAEKTLWTSERNLQLIIDTIPALVWSTDVDGSLEFVNQHYIDYVGLPLEQLRGWGWTAAVHPNDLGGLTAAWRAILASGKSGEAEARFRRADGEYRWLMSRVNPLHDGNGNIVDWYGLNTDIEDRKRAELHLAGEKHILEIIASGRPLREVLAALCRFFEGSAPD
jgi:PAS domain S-box-containing protein